MSETFELHARLTADTFVVGDWPLCRVLLMNDRQYPWLILVPRRADIRESYQLSPSDQQQLWAESIALGQAMMSLYHGDKLNVAALGNMVPQLHWHHIVRFAKDPAWPAPVWGKVPAVPYTDSEAKNEIKRLSEMLNKPFMFVR